VRGLGSEDDGHRHPTDAGDDVDVGDRDEVADEPERSTAWIYWATPKPATVPLEPSAATPRSGTPP
jgi:hypothetical protein